MAGGVALFDFDDDGDLDMYFTNGAQMPGLQKTSSKYWNRLLENDGKGQFSDVTERAGVAGAGYDTGVSVADYDNDGDQDIFVAGVHHYTLFNNDGNGRFANVTSAAGLDRPDTKHGPLWAVDSAWLDFDNDGLLDLFVVNYLSWDPGNEKFCGDYCHPKFYRGSPNRLYHNEGDGTFTDVSAESGIRAHVGKGMGAAIADFDQDGLLDIFVTNDKEFNFFFHNGGNGKFEEIAFEAGVALPEHGREVSGMGADFKDIDNDGLPDIAFVALDSETFPLFRNTGSGRFEEVTSASGLARLTMRMAGYSPCIFDFDNDGWKDLFVSRGHVQSPAMTGGAPIKQRNSVFRNLGDGVLAPLREEGGFAEGPAERHRGAAVGDVNGDGRMDVVVTALDAEAELWVNESSPGNHWLAVQLEGTLSNRDGIGASLKVVTRSGVQYNHLSTSVGYASSSAGPVHFGLGRESAVDSLEIRWPSGQVQVINRLRSNQVLRVKEPAGVSP